MINKEEFLKETDQLKTTKEKGDYFLRTLTSEFYPDEDINYVDGSGDGGIDAYFTDEEENVNNWIIIQSKYGTSYQGMDSICGEFSKIFVHLEDNEFRGNDNSFVYFRDFLKDTNKKKRVVLVILTNEKINEQDLSALDSIKKVFSERYNAEFEVENLYIDLLSERSKSEKPTEVVLSGNFIKDDGSGELVGKVSFANLYRFIKTFVTITGDINLLYKSNIRLHLKNKLAEDITDTIKNDPDKFFQRNNGITLLTDGIKYDDKNNLILTNPDCNNGCQTSSNAYKYMKDSLVIPKANLCVTIIDVSKLSEEDKRKITECRNKQTTVKNVGKAFIFDKRVGNIKDKLKTFGKILQIKKGEYSPKKIDFVDLFAICLCIVDGKPGIAKAKQDSYYESRGNDFLTKLDNDNEFLLLTYRLAELCDTLKRPSYKYYASTLRYSFIAILYTLLEEAYKKESNAEEPNYKKILNILDDKDLFDYFMTNTKVIIDGYTRITGKMTEALYTKDLGHNNLERLSKTLDLKNKVDNLNILINNWSSMYDLNDVIKNKVLNVVN